MSNSENQNAVKDESSKKEIKKANEVKAIKETVKAVKPVKTIIEPVKSQKSDRLDRMENQLNLIEDGLLVLINSTQWHNLSITPIGTHNPNNLIDGYDSLEEAVAVLLNDDGEKIKQ